jgi:hypothetical protein
MLPAPLVDVLPAKRRFFGWAMLGSNQRSLPCEGSTIGGWRFLELAEFLQIADFLC